MELPKDAKQVFSGREYEVYQWRKFMADGSVKTFELAALKTSVIVLATIEHKILVLIDEGKEPYRMLPSGPLLASDTPLTCAKRCLEAATGFSTHNLVVVSELFADPKISARIHLVAARNCTPLAKLSSARPKVEMLLLPEFLQLCRMTHFLVPAELKFLLYEALLDSNLAEELQTKIFS